MVLLSRICIMCIHAVAAFSSDTIRLKSLNPLRSSSSACDDLTPEEEKLPQANYLKENYETIVAAVFNNGDSRPVILFDGVCNMCSSSVNFAPDHDNSGRFRFAALQSITGKALLLHDNKDANDISSIVLVESLDRYRYKSDAILGISSGLDDTVLKVFGVVGRYAAPPFIRDAVYNVVSTNRYRFMGQNDQCRVSDDNFDDRFIPDPVRLSSINKST